MHSEHLSQSIRQAATVVLLRDSEQGLQTLLLKRNKALKFAGGFWVFPGGGVETVDIDGGAGDMAVTARLAARREAEEEAGISPALDDMVPISHWTTPETEPRRFATWFFAAPVSDDAVVQIDGGEIHDWRWMSPVDALALHKQGELMMMPPTFVSLQNLTGFQTLAEFQQGYDRIPYFEVTPVLGRDGETPVTMYPGDAGYCTGNANVSGSRHRLAMRDKCWWFVCEGLPASQLPLIAKAT